MKVQKIRLRTDRGIPESISNLWYGNDCDVAQIEDAIDDSLSALPWKHKLPRVIQTEEI